MTLSYISGLPALQSLHIGYIQKEAQVLPMEPLAFCNTIQNLHIQVSNALSMQPLPLPNRITSYRIIICIKYKEISLSRGNFMKNFGESSLQKEKVLDLFF